MMPSMCRRREEGQEAKGEGHPLSSRLLFVNIFLVVGPFSVASGLVTGKSLDSPRRENRDQMLKNVRKMSKTMGTCLRSLASTIFGYV